MNELVPIDIFTPAGSLIPKVAYYEALINRWLHDSDLRPQTKKSYRKWITYFLEWIEYNNINNPTHKDVLRYKEELRLLELSGHTISCYIIAVRQFFSWCEFNRIYPDVAKRVKTEKRSSKHKREALTKAQALRMLDLIKKPRDRALFLLLITTGLRLCEVHRADVGDIQNRADKTVLWVQGKAHSEKDDFVILNPLTLDTLQEYLNGRKAEDKDPLFITTSTNYYGWRLGIKSMSGIIRRYMVEAGFKTPRICPHSTRHTAVTFSLLGGATLQEAQQLARHSSIETTMIYSHNLDRLASNPESKIIDYLQGE